MTRLARASCDVMVIVALLPVHGGMEGEVGFGFAMHPPRKGSPTADITLATSVRATTAFSVSRHICIRYCPPHRLTVSDCESRDREPLHLHTACCAGRSTDAVSVPSRTAYSIRPPHDADIIKIGEPCAASAFPAVETCCIVISGKLRSRAEIGELCTLVS